MAGNSIAAGAQAGAAFGPWGAAIGGAMGAATDMASAAMGGPFMGGDSKATYGDVNTDHSGWTVSIGSGSASTNNAQTKRNTSNKAADEFARGIGFGGGGPVFDMGGGGEVMQAGMNPLMMMFLGGTALMMILKRRK